jgi:hypothetical protein
MVAVRIYNLEPASFGPGLAKRGHHVVYRAEETNRCPGCGRSNWHVGRLTAECAFCGAAVPLAEAAWDGRGATRGKASEEIAPARRRRPSGAERRRHERVPVKDRTLQLLIEGSPQSFAICNLSAGGLMGEAPVPLEQGANVQVRFEGGIIVPATVRWTSDGLIGLAFDAPVIFDAAGSN